jgi:hypothetical protein
MISAIIKSQNEVPEFSVFDSLVTHPSAQQHLSSALLRAEQIITTKHMTYLLMAHITFAVA